MSCIPKCLTAVIKQMSQKIECEIPEGRTQYATTEIADSQIKLMDRVRKQVMTLGEHHHNPRETINSASQE